LPEKLTYYTYNKFFKLNNNPHLPTFLFSQKFRLYFHCNFTFEFQTYYFINFLILYIMKKATLLICFIVCASSLFAQGTVLLDKSNISLAAVSSTEGDSTGDLIFDDNTSSFWHSNLGSGYPNWALIDLGAPANIAKIDIYRRPGAYSDTKTVVCYVSSQPWYTDPTTDSSWKRIGEVVFSSTYNDDKRILEVGQEIDDASGQYLLLYLPDSQYPDRTYGQIAEINVYVEGGLNVTPDSQTVSGAAGSSAEYAITTDGGSWEATTTADWVSLQQSGNTLTATATANYQLTDRRATIKVASNGSAINVDFIQSSGAIPGNVALLDKSSMTVLEASSVEGTGYEYLILDGDDKTWWHSDLTIPLPHWVLVDLGSQVDINRVQIIRREFSPWSDTRTVQCYVGNDPWYSDPTAINTSWHKIGEVVFPKEANGDERALGAAQGTATGRYLLLYLPDSQEAGRPYGQIAEIYVYKYTGGNLIPSIEEIPFQVFTDGVKNQLNIVTEHAVKGIALINSSGQTVLNISGKNVGNQRQIDLSSFAQGIYFLRISTENQTYTKKVVKW
jgi:hypothetical protein